MTLLLSPPADGNEYYFLWLTAVVNLFQAEGYLMFSPWIGVGDFRATEGGFLEGLEPSWAWKTGLSVGGLVLTGATIFLANSLLEPLLGNDDSTRSSRRWLLTLPAYLVGSALVSASGLLNRAGPEFALSSVLATFAGTLFLAYLPMFFSADLFNPGSRSTHKALAMNRSVPWMVVGTAVALTAVTVFGPGIGREYPRPGTPCSAPPSITSGPVVRGRKPPGPAGSASPSSTPEPRRGAQPRGLGGRAVDSRRYIRQYIRHADHDSHSASGTAHGRCPGSEAEDEPQQVHRGNPRGSSGTRTQRGALAALKFFDDMKQWREDQSHVDAVGELKKNVASSRDATRGPSRYEVRVGHERVLRVHGGGRHSRGPARRTARRRGAGPQPVIAEIDDFDIAIAAHALVEGAVVATDNVRHFERVPGLQVENWLRGQ